MANGFKWKTDTLTGPVKQFPLKLERAIVAAIEFHATRAEGDLRRNAPWTDRSSNARGGLFTATEHVPYRAHRIILSHTVPYGIWLEIRHSGKYAVILPTTQTTGRAVMASLGGLFSKIIELG